MIFTIATKEFRGFFSAPSTWMILGALQFIFAWFFLARIDAFMLVQAQLAQIANAPGATLAVVTPLFGTIALIMMLLVPLFTMRLLAEERRNQTLTLLMTAPISSSHIVLGKFVGLLSFLLLIIAEYALMVLTLAVGTQLDFGLLLSNILGLLLLTTCYAAFGLYISTLTSQPLVAAITALAALFGLWLVDFSTIDSGIAWRAFAPTSHFQNFNVGLLHSNDMVFFLLFSVTFLLLAIRRLNNNRIYG